MKKVKYINNKPTFVDEDSNDDGKLRIGGKTINEILAMGSKSKPSGNISSRVDFSNEKIGPKFKSNAKKESKKEMPPGDMGSVDTTDDVIGPDMSKITKADEEKEPAVEKEPVAKKEPVAEKELDLQEKARRSMGFKKGGTVKSSSASKRADGCAQRGKTKGKIC